MTKEEEKKLDKLIAEFPLKDQYAMICEFYARELNRMWETDGEWIRDNYCTFEVADCYISNEELRILVDNKVEWEVFYEWYNYQVAMHYGMDLGKKNAVVINLEHWLKGFPNELKVPEEEYATWEKEYYAKEFGDKD